MSPTRNGRMNAEQHKTTETYFASALEHYGARRFKQGDRASGAVKRLAPGGFHDCLLEGMHLVIAGRFEEALAAFERAVALDRTSGLALAQRGVALFCLERDAEALAALERATPRCA